ncbi:MAG: 3'(2'),5'-bisphosphate nucleotidase CysQ [Acidimicrobiales bacterium]|nr:MAG: 3'(2'),5'-bisphosphate nucleotidase CysQ [Acidimicrobiales bacterium]
MSSDADTSGLAGLVDADDHILARRLAQEAGEILCELRSRACREGTPPEDLRNEGDALSNRHIVQTLRRERPDDGLLSEETTDDRARLGKRRVWIVDPLDGTREFAEPPRDDWAVHVALVVDGRPLVGAVALPARGIVYSTPEPPPPPQLPERTLRLLVSRTRPPRFVRLLAERLGGELLEMGSAGAKAMAVLEGRADVYVHAGGQYEWDSAAPVAVCEAAGLHTSRVDGSPLVYNRPDPLLPDLLISRPEIARVILDELRSVDVVGDS